LVGIEPEAAMRKVAFRKARGIRNVRFLKGRAERIPLKTSSVDAVVAITSVPIYVPSIPRMKRNTEKFIKEASRVPKEGGVIVVVGVAPFWYGGELAEIILGGDKTTDEDTEGKTHRILVEGLGFQFEDVMLVQRFNSLEEALSTYGFIFGKKAIKHLLLLDKKEIKWKFRMYFKTLPVQAR
jgi:ubiquinone/menaquinone biosynthesis C-methylase UbiE